MTKNKRLSFFQKHWGKIIIICLTIGIFLIVFNPKTPQTKAKESEPILPKIEYIELGNWEQSSNINITGNIFMQSETDIVAETAGKLAKILIKIGQNVTKGQIIGQISSQNNIAQINFQNAYESLKNAESTAQNSHNQARISVENIQIEEQNLRNNQITKTNELIQSLYLKQKSLYLISQNFLDWSDGIFYATQEIDRGNNTNNNNKIGFNDIREKQSIKNDVFTIKEAFKKTNLFSISQNKEESVTIRKGKQILNFSLEIANLAKRVTVLINNTPESPQTLASYEQKATTYENSIIQNMDAVRSLVNSLENYQKQKKSELDRIQNQIISAQSAYQLTQSQTQAQVNQAQNAFNISQKSNNDLYIRAPFSGTISSIYVKEFEYLTPGKKIFQLQSTAKNSNMYVKIFVSPEEADYIKNSSVIKIKANETEILAKNFLISQRLNSTTQKKEVRLIIPVQYRKKIINGSFVQVLLDTNKKQKQNIIPITSVEFLPDGQAFVFFINDKNEIERKTIKIGKLKQDTLVIGDELPEKTKIVFDASLVNTSEKIEPILKKE